MGEPALRLLTLEEYDALPSDGQRYEILGGLLRVTPAPSFEHQRAVMVLGRLLDQWVSARRLGVTVPAPLDVVLGNDTVVQPDLVYLSTRRCREIVRGRVYGPPDLIVEVLSPGTESVDRTAKHQLYARSGVKEYWIVSLKERRIERFVLRKGSYGQGTVHGASETVKSSILPGLSIRVDEVFETV